MKRDFHDARLRPMREIDLDMILKWRNSDRIRLASHKKNIISPEEHREWFTRTTKDDSRRAYIFEFRGEPAGFIHFFEINSLDRTCSWGFYLGRDDLPKGTGSVMGSAALDLVFSELKMDRVKAEVLSDNPRSAKYHEKLGFKLQSSDAGFKIYQIEKNEWQDTRRLIA